MSCEQLPAVNTWFKLIEIILLICTMATSQHNAAPEVKPAVKACRDLATLLLFLITVLDRGCFSVSSVFLGRDQRLPAAL